MKNKTLGEKTAENLVKLIQKESYVSGQKLPNEYELSSLLGVGRNTIREALKMLASRNIIIIRQGSGIFLSDKPGFVDDPLGFSFVADRKKLTFDLLQIRLIIEPQIASLAAQNATIEDIKELEISFKNTETQLLTREPFSKEDVEFHTRIANCSHNNVISKIIPVITAGVTFFSSEVNEQEYEQTIKSHRQIFEAIRSGHSFDAHQAMLFHLLYNQNRFLEEFPR